MEFPEPHNMISKDYKRIIKVSEQYHFLCDPHHKVYRDLRFYGSLLYFDQHFLLLVRRYLIALSKWNKNLETIPGVIHFSHVDIMADIEQAVSDYRRDILPLVCLIREYAHQALL